MTATERAAAIAALNDAFRTRFDTRLGRIMLTDGVAALDETTTAAVLARVQTFDAFTADNDPHHEHDFGAFEIGGERFFWKIDYYERNSGFLAGAERPENATTTERVLTIMFASEY